ncbi:MAG: efflux RND transporter periplasmic adaptor subunit [Gammaproteobacteria bacterium]|nr:efflux RND transporter periplasmic adaptor subunit [Gammaproteobacteria bacterium]
MRARYLMTALLGCGLWGGCLAGTAAELPFETATVSYQDVPREQAFDAVIEAVQQSTVSAQVNGRVVEINVDVGDFVPRDGVLIRIRNAEQRAGLAAGQAALSEAEARHKEAQAEFERVNKIYEKRLLPKAALDKASADLKAAQARVESAQAGMKQAGEQLGYTVIRAPYSGVVQKRHVEVGESVTIGQPLMSGYSLETLRAVANVPQDIMPVVRTLKQARVRLDDPAHTVTSERLTFTPYADAVTHTYKVRAELPSGIESVYPGMFAKVLFVTGTDRRLLIPARALVLRSEVTAVYVVDRHNRVALRQLRTGTSIEPDMIEVLGGLAEGERIALDPLRAGARLKEQHGP